MYPNLSGKKTSAYNKRDLESAENNTQFVQNRNETLSTHWTTWQTKEQTVLKPIDYSLLYYDNNNIFFNLNLSPYKKEKNTMKQ